MLLSPSTGKRPRTRSGSAFCPSYPVLPSWRDVQQLSQLLCSWTTPSSAKAIKEVAHRQFHIHLACNKSPRSLLCYPVITWMQPPENSLPSVQTRPLIHSLQISGLNVEVTACISIADSIRYAKLTLLSYEITSTLITPEVNSSGFFIYEAV